MRVLRAFAGSILLLSLLASAVSAQTCPGATATLTITPTTCVSTGSQVTVQLCGTPNAMAMVLVSDGRGSWHFPGQMGHMSSFTLCLQVPMMFTRGFTDASGCASDTWVVPPGVPAGTVFHFQGMLMTMGTPGGGGGGPHRGGGGMGHQGPGPMQMNIQTSDVATLCFQ